MSNYLSNAEYQNPYQWGDSNHPDPLNYIRRPQTQQQDPDLNQIKQQIDNLEEWEEFCEEKPVLSELLEAMFGEGAIYVFKKCGPLSESRAMRMMGELQVQTQGSTDRLEKAIMTESIS
jgi:hypothetical protein